MILQKLYTHPFSRHAKLLALVLRREFALFRPLTNLAEKGSKLSTEKKGCGLYPLGAHAEGASVHVGVRPLALARRLSMPSSAPLDLYDGRCL